MSWGERGSATPAQVQAQRGERGSCFAESALGGCAKGWDNEAELMEEVMEVRNSMVG